MAKTTKKAGKSAGRTKITITEDERRSYIAGLTLMHDEFMSVCLDGDIECAQLMLRVIMDKPDLAVTSVTVQREIKSVGGRSVKLDVKAEDSEGKHYDIEVQRDDEGAIPRRARFYSSMLDGSILRKGQDFASLPETYVIFITKNDVLGRGLPLYVINRRIEGLNEPFDDGAHIIYVNASIKDAATALGRLMHDLACRNADEMYYSVLADRVRYFKETEEGALKMNAVAAGIERKWEKRGEARGLRKGRKEGLSQGRVEGVLSTARRMLSKGLTAEQAADLSGLPVDEVRALQ